MSARSIPLHLGLLILTLVAAWATFRGQLQGDSPSNEEGVVVLQAAVGDVQRVVYETERRTLRLEARRDEGGRWFEGSEIVSQGEGVETETAPQPETKVSSPEYWLAVEGRARHFGLLIGAQFGEPFDTRLPLAVSDLMSLLPRGLR